MAVAVPKVDRWTSTVPGENTYAAEARGLADALRDIEGEVRFSAGDQALYATDLSVFRQLPIGVVTPRTVDFSKYLHHVVDYDPLARSAWVEPGTFGGMIGNVRLALARRGQNGRQHRRARNPTYDGDDHFADLSLNQWMALTPAALVKAHLNLDDGTLAALRKDKPVVVSRC